MFMNIKLAMAVLVTSSVVYLTVPIAGPVIWQEFDEDVFLLPHSPSTMFGNPEVTDGLHQAAMGALLRTGTDISLAEGTTKGLVASLNKALNTDQINGEVVAGQLQAVLGFLTNAGLFHHGWTQGPIKSTFQGFFGGENAKIVDDNPDSILKDKNTAPQPRTYAAETSVGFTADYGIVERADEEIPIVSHPTADQMQAMIKAEQGCKVDGDCSITGAPTKWLERISKSLNQTTEKAKFSMLYRTQKCEWMEQTQFNEASTKVSRCKNAKRAHRGLVLMYVFYLLTAAFHTFAPEKVRPGIPFYVHVVFLLVSWSLLLTLVISHTPSKYDHYGGYSEKQFVECFSQLFSKEITEGDLSDPIPDVCDVSKLTERVSTKWNGSTLAVALVALLLQFGDLCMTGYSKYIGKDYTPAMAAVYSNAMYAYAGHHM